MGRQLKKRRHEFDLIWLCQFCQDEWNKYKAKDNKLTVQDAYKIALRDHFLTVYFCRSGKTLFRMPPRDTLPSFSTFKKYFYGFRKAATEIRANRPNP